MSVIRDADQWTSLGLDTDGMEIFIRPVLPSDPEYWVRNPALSRSQTTAEQELQADQGVDYDTPADAMHWTPEEGITP